MKSTRRDKKLCSKIISLSKRKKYSYRHIQLIVHQENKVKPSLDFIWQLTHTSK